MAKYYRYSKSTSSLQKNQCRHFGEKRLLQRTFFIGCRLDTKYLITTTLLLKYKYPPPGTKNHTAQLFFFNRNAPLLK